MLSVLIMGDLFFNEISHNPIPPAFRSKHRTKLAGLKILSQNTNTLNASGLNNARDRDKFFTKMVAILKKGADIICLQDVRLSIHIEDFKNYFNLTSQGSYECFINSSKDERGVVTLVKKSLNYTVLKQYNSACENICILDMIINGVRLLITNLYGPKQTENSF